MTYGLCQGYDENIDVFEFFLGVHVTDYQILLLSSVLSIVMITITHLDEVKLDGHTTYNLSKKKIIQELKY